MRHMSEIVVVLLVSLAAGLLAALLCGCLLYGLPEPATLLSRLFAPLLGGALAGVLAAARK